MESVEQVRRNTIFQITTTFVICLFLVVLFSGCARKTKVGQQFDISKVSEIRKGKTTKRDILSLFGSPYSKGQGGGFERWIYQYSEIKSGGMFAGYKTMFGGSRTANHSFQSMTITFKGNIVHDYNTHTVGQ